MIAKFGFNLLTALIVHACANMAVAGQLYFVDAHSQVGRESDLARIVPLMDEAGVKHTILSAMREVRNRDVVKLAKKHPTRITASIGLKSRRYLQNQPDLAENLRSAEETGRFGAISEALVSHREKKKTEGPEVGLNLSSPQVGTALQVALRNHWPFIIHIEFASLSRKGLATFERDLGDLLKTHPTHPFVLIHMGQLSPERAESLITAHQNIHFMTSRADPIDIARSRGTQPWQNMFAGDRLTPGWKRLLATYPERFIFAMDNHIAEDHWDSREYPRRVALWRKALSDLSPDAAEAIAHGNAERLWQLQPSGHE